MHSKAFFGGLVAASLAAAELKGVTVTTAAPSKVIAIESFISNYDHHTLGINTTVGGIIYQVDAQSSAYPTPAIVLEAFRSRINYLAGPTPFLKDLENPASVVSSIAAVLPTISPYPQALELISSVYDYLGSVASSELNDQITLPYNISVSLGTYVPEEPSSAPVSTPASTTKPASTPAQTTGTCVGPTKKAGKWCKWDDRNGGFERCW
ncbi:hypothetical protein B0J14DRAFT_71571 [Halenospora varia]|nr:hypothetical protein B0J14DRAFT_71571 [Halenospora varia]